MSLLIIGGTGTLGRQIVRRALDEGFQVKCLVRNFKKGAFLKEWGAELVYGDLTLPETVPLTLYGITAIIDVSTTRVNDLYNARIIDFQSKCILIDAAIKAKIKKYIFFSILNSNQYIDIPLMKFKFNIENKLIKSRMNYTVFRLAGFFQGIIPQYAIPILDKQPIWTTKDSTQIPYINTQDISRITIKSLSIQQCNKRIFPIVGDKAWNSFDIIKLCEKISGQRAKISRVPLSAIQFMKQFTYIFQWSWNISDRLAFIELLSRGDNFNDSMNELYQVMHFKKSDIESLDCYLQEYFEKIMNKLKQLNYEKFSVNDIKQEETNF